MRTILIKMAISVIALAMVVGVASAAPAEVRITPGSATIPYDPGYFTYNVDIYDIDNVTASRVLIVTTIIGPSNKETHLKFRFTNDSGMGLSSPWLNHDGSWEWGTPTGGLNYENLTMDVMAVGGAPEGVDYGIKVEDYEEGTTLWDYAYATTVSTTIPEFATIALPVATILGLLFFFNHRKRRKE